jgi:hypothetical protein
MAFETEDSSRISWFMGTVSAVQVADPIRWPNSPWRLLQVNKPTSITANVYSHLKDGISKFLPAYQHFNQV